MARKTETREIGRNRFRVMQFKARKSNRIAERIIRLIAPALGAAAENLGETDADKTIAGDLSKVGIADAVTKFGKALDGNQLNWLIDESIPAIEYQTPELLAAQPDTFVPMTGELWDDVFADCPTDQFKLLAFVSELSLNRFFVGLDGIRGVVQRFVTPTVSVSKSPTTATTGSGASSSASA